MKIDVDALAQEIRRVDGNHSLGAGALAEALMPFLSAALSEQTLPVRVQALEWKEDWGGSFDDIPEWRADTPWGRLTASMAGHRTPGGVRYERHHEVPADLKAALNTARAIAATALDALVDVPAVESEPVAWVIPGDDNANSFGFIDAMAWEVGEFTRPLYAHPPRSSLTQSEEGWRTMKTAPKDGSKFDVWCVNPEHPEAYGVRFNNVQMRGDGSGFGFVMYLRDGVYWQYLDAREPDSILPAWNPTHWMPLPTPPSPYGEGCPAAGYTERLVIPQEAK